MTLYGSPHVQAAVPASQHTTGTRTNFTTPAPTLSTERANATQLSQVFEHLVAQVAAWTARLAQDRASALSADAISAFNNNQPRSPHVATPTLHESSESQFAEAASSPASSPTVRVVRNKLSPSRRHTQQTPGEDAALFFQPQATQAVRLVPPSTSVGEGSISGGAAARPTALPSPKATAPANTTSTASHSPTTSDHNQTTSSPTAAPTASVGQDDMTNTSMTNISSATSTTALPPWLTMELETFFDAALAPAIQGRETQLVNVMHECVVQELQLKERRVQEEAARVATLEAQVKEFEILRDHFQSKLDRRVAENNALRKDFYKQLLMLRELVSKQRNDPRTLKALDEVLAAVATGGKVDPGEALAAVSMQTGAQKKSAKVDDTALSSPTSNSNAMAVRREKDKWEQRAREAVAESQQLQEQILHLKQQLEEARGMDGKVWFANAQHGIYERQRIIDSVFKSRCTWEEVGDAVVELLNNEMVWEAVENSAYREKSRVSRGLEAVLLRVESIGRIREHEQEYSLADLETEMVGHSDKRHNDRRRSAFSQASRLIACRACNGCGYLEASACNQNADYDDDSYLRKTLAQVLELKTSLEEANNRTNQVEQQLLRTVMEGAQIKEKLEKIEFVRSHSVDCALQVDLDEEEEVNIDEITNAHSQDDGESTLSHQSRHRGARARQYEHLIVELKNLLVERDAAIIHLRSTVTDAQARLVAVQRASQQEQEQLQRELQTLKSSLVIALKNRNERIEEKQASVKQLLKGFSRKQSNIPSKNFLGLDTTSSKIMRDTSDNGEASVDDESDTDDVYIDEFEVDEEDDVKRSELIARRYSEAISRVQREHDEQQTRLKHAEDELSEESDRRKRTNSITMGNIVVTMTSHPRDLFKALSSTHQGLLSLRRSSHRSSALQTDRLLTLTTHLAHISEELAMVKKRTNAEIEFWKLDCEKLQNANDLLAADLRKAQSMVEEVHQRAIKVEETAAPQVCPVCAKHEARLLAISSHLLEGRTTPSSSYLQDSDDRQTPARTMTSQSQTQSATLSPQEKRELCSILVDLENMYSTLSSAKQYQAKSVIVRALAGRDTGIEPRDFSPNLPFVGASERDRRATTTGVVSSERNPLLERAQQIRNASEGLSAAGRKNDSRSSLFRASVADAFEVFNESSETRDETLVLQGSAIQMTRDGNPSIPNHHRKKIVRKVLSEHEVVLGRRTRGNQNIVLMPQEDRHIFVASGLEKQNEFEQQPEDPCNSNVSTFIDENGEVVYYVDVEVPDDGDSEDIEAGQTIQQDSTSLSSMLHPPTHSPHANNGASFSRRSEYSIHIPSPDNPVVGAIVSGSRRLMLTGEEIDKDPEVIEKLRELVQHNRTTTELLALNNWKILLSHLRAAGAQRRLDYINERFREAMPANKRSLSPISGNRSLPIAVRTTMQKLLQSHELAIDAMIRERNELKKESRRAQAQLIHSASTVLTTLSQKIRSRTPSLVSFPLVHLSRDAYRQRSPSPKNSPNRPVFPSVRVNLSEIPPTQHIPTFHFPISTGSSISETQITYPPVDETPSALLCNSRVVPPVKDGGRLVDSYVPSIFENDNRFPQRAVKFVPAGDSDEPSLTHSTSSIRFPSVSPSTAPTKSPSKAGLALDSRRLTHSAGVTRFGTPNAEYGETSPPRNYYPTPPPVGEGGPSGGFRRPSRPQSSPASMAPRVTNPQL